MMRDLDMNTCGVSRFGVKCGILFILALAWGGSPASGARGATIHSSDAAPSGMAWDVHGTWHAKGGHGTILTGDTIQPGVLLDPGKGELSHSITILLPDGQSILYECFTAKDCARGFRVPVLFRTPEPFAVEMLGRIRAALAEQGGRTAAAPAKETHIARDEAAAVLGPGNRIEIGGLAASLSNGEYSGDLRSFDARYPEQSGIPLQKSGRSLALTVPGPGLFLLTIIDSMKWPRIEFMIAVEPTQGNSVIKDFKDVHALMMKWREEFFGWPMHDFQRAYLQSLMLGIQPANGSEQKKASTDPLPPGVTAEPMFTPKPGVLEGETAITLQCATPGAIIHYTVDSSQPLENSPVYHTPIVVKGIPVRIKAFADSPGKKDSPVVMGNFRIRDQKD
ncbi:MAG TPA: FN3 associated domain-containing protein [Terracidiphilus sp.]|nr:FN3 associated domain-containing protein [Terracidiphilus sp.]